MKFYVYYKDDFEDMGGVGIEIFGTEEEVCRFIEERMKEGYNEKTIKDYLVIEGNEKDIITVKEVEKIKLS